MYWTDAGTDYEEADGAEKIQRANLDGSMAVAMIVIVLAMPFQARGQTPTVVVNPVTNAAGDGSSTASTNLTDMFLASLLRTNVFNVIDARMGRQVSADFYLTASFSYREEQVEVEEGEEDTRVRLGRNDSSGKRDSRSVKRSGTQVTSVRIDISVTNSSGEVLFADYREHSHPINETSNQSAASGAEPIVEYLAGRLATYIDILGPRFRAKSVEAKVVAIVGPTTAVVGKGSKAGLAPGDELEIRRGDIIINADGDIIFSRLENIGTAEVSEVQDEGALITVPASLKLEEGDTVVRAVSEPSVTEHVETGDALFEASFYMRAIREYLAALDSDPELLDVLFPLGVAQMKTGDHGAAYESFAEFLDAGQPVELAATHNHAFGRCQGTFILTRESVSYRSPQEDDPDHWFDVPLERVVESRLRFDKNLVIRAPSAEHIEKNKDDSKNWTLTFDLRGENTEVARISSRYILRSQGR